MFLLLQYLVECSAQLRQFLTQRELGEQGRVQLRVRVSPQGRALQVDLVSSSHSRRLDEAARQAVAAWRFQPARQDGVAIESSLLVPITFSLPPP